ncbi:MAG TPA: BON domain-containing protein [Acidobacteriota bacterium]|jgi:osmotically-inducible protein OsmY
MRKTLFLFISSVVFLPACSGGEQPKERVKIKQPAPQKGKTETWQIQHDLWVTDSDRDLAREIRQVLIDDAETVPFAEAVAIEVNNGAVVLRGSGAYTLADAEWQSVGRRAKSVKGVKSVEVKSRVDAAE